VYEANLHSDAYGALGGAADVVAVPSYGLRDVGVDAGGGEEGA